MPSIKNKNPLEKVVILIGLIVLLGLLGFALYKLITKREIDNPITWYRVIDNDKYGVIGENGDEIVPCIYKAIGPFEDGLAVVVDQSGKYGYVGIDGSMVIPCRYERAYGFNDGWGRVCRNGKYYYINTKGNTVFQNGYDYVYEFSEGLARIYQDGKFGFINKKGELITPIAYDRAWDFENDIAIVVVGRDMYVIGKDGKRKTYGDYSMFRFHNLTNIKGILAVKDGKWGYIDYNENTLLDFIYDAVYWVDDYSGTQSYLTVKYNNKYGAYDTDGHCLIPPIYDRILMRLGTYPSVCKKEEKYGLAHVPESFIYDDIDPIMDSERYIVKEGSLYGVIDHGGVPIIPCKYSWIWYEEEANVYVVEFEDERWGLLDENGKYLSNAYFDELDGFYDGLAPACVNGKYGFINKDGRVVIDFQYEDAECFSDGFAAVKMNGKYGYIDTKGRLVSGCRYDSAGDFDGETAVVKINGMEWLLGASGELLTKRPYFFIGSKNSNSFPDGNYSEKYWDLTTDYAFNGTEW